jgi:plasmid stability protein
MPQLNVDDIENELFIQLREIAADEGESFEELVRTILRNAVKEKQSKHLATRLIDRFSSVGLKDDESLEGLRGQQVQSPDFGQ